MTNGETSPAVTPTIASSRSASPSGSRPCSTRTNPWNCSASARRSGVAKPLSDGGGLVGGGERGVQLARREALEGGGQQQPPLLDVVALLGLDEAVGAAEPAPGGPDLSASREVHAEPAGGARGAERVTGIEVGAVNALEQRLVLVRAPDQRGSGREPLEILHVERRRPIRR